LPSDLSRSVIGQQASIERHDQAENALVEHDNRLFREIGRIWEKLDEIRSEDSGETSKIDP